MVIFNIFTISVGTCISCCNNLSSKHQATESFLLMATSNESEILLVMIDLFVMKFFFFIKSFLYRKDHKERKAHVVMESSQPHCAGTVGLGGEDIQAGGWGER
jgi:hypothetical protein